ncbi:MAG: glycosyltransferase [Oscillospiraceae bacterium]|nr:glycosyltransferase [Oscillospiraceae bacterium]
MDYTKVSVSLLSILNRGELFAEVPPEVRILNKNPSQKSILGTQGALYIAGRAFRQVFRSAYIFRFIPYAIVNLITQLKARQFKQDKLLWFLFAETTPVPDEEYDMAIAFLEGAATYYVSGKVKARKKLAFVHVNYHKAGYIKKLDHPYYQKIDAICCISEAVKQVFTSVYPEHKEKTIVFPNIVLQDEIRAKAAERGGFEDGFEGIRLLTVGRLHHQKGYDIAIPAFAELVKSGYDNVKWYVIGEGTERARLEKLIAKHDLQGNYILLGQRSNPHPFIAQCDIYIQPSRFEGFPLTLTEALTLKKPCITTNFEGVSDLLTDGENAIVVELSEKSICNAVQMLISDGKLRRRLSEAAGQIKFDSPGNIQMLYDMLSERGG